MDRFYLKHRLKDWICARTDKKITWRVRPLLAKNIRDLIYPWEYPIDNVYRGIFHARVENYTLSML